MLSKTSDKLIVLVAATVMWTTGSADADPSVYYPFSGNAENAMGDYLHGTVHGATLTTDSDANADSAYSFDGNNDYIQVEDDGTLSGMSNLDVSCKFYANDWGAITGGLAGLVSKVNNGDGLKTSDSYNLAILTDQGKHYLLGEIFTHIGIGGADVTVRGEVSASQITGWHEARLTYDMQHVRIYFDGTEIDSAPHDRVLNDNENVPLTIGNMYGTSVANLYMDGKIDEVRIIPEPTTLSLLTLGGLALLRRRRK
jgi:hypothetical protein